MGKRFASVCLTLLAAFCLLPGTEALAEQTRELVPMGNTIGIEMKLDGVMIVGLSEVETDSGMVRPAEDAGLQIGDVIVALAGRQVKAAADFVSAVAKLDGESVELVVRREEQDIECRVTPAKNKEGAFQLGLWLRDGVSGIGTVTYYDPVSGEYGALGHGILDVDTGELVPVCEAYVTPAEVVDVVPGREGTPGELCGKMAQEHVGSVLDNTNAGIFGVYEAEVSAQELPVANEDEIVLGPATILSNVSGCEVKEYAVEIRRIYRDSGDYRCMMLCVTDPVLLSSTGGIVQGMSGSPIIQNGKLIGAVTHVLVQDPTRGYGISLEDMLEAAG